MTVLAPEPTISSDEEEWNPGPRPGNPLRHWVEYRESKDAGWTASHADWSFEEIAHLNAMCGWEMYRIVRVTA